MAKSRSSEDIEEEELDPGDDEELGAIEGAGLDEGLGDDEGGLLAALPASDAGRASAVRMLDLLVEKRALALHKAKPGKRLIEKVAQVLESRGPLNQRAAKLSETIVDSKDVDELFVDDETLMELLKRW